MHTFRFLRRDLLGKLWIRQQNLLSSNQNFGDLRRHPNEYASVPTPHISTICHRTDKIAVPLQIREPIIPELPVIATVFSAALLKNLRRHGDRIAHAIIAVALPTTNPTPTTDQTNTASINYIFKVETPARLRQHPLSSCWPATSRPLPIKSQISDVYITLHLLRIKLDYNRGVHPP